MKQTGDTPEPIINKFRDAVAGPLDGAGACDAWSGASKSSHDTFTNLERAFTLCEGLKRKWRL
jgi:hypothetical protein